MLGESRGAWGDQKGHRFEQTKEGGMPRSSVAGKIRYRTPGRREKKREKRNSDAKKK